MIYIKIGPTFTMTGSGREAIRISVTGHFEPQIHCSLKGFIELWPQVSCLGQSCLTIEPVYLF